MAYLLGQLKKIPQAQGQVSKEGVPLPIQERELPYVLLDAQTKQPVVGQKLRRKGKNLQVWIDDKLVQELHGFFITPFPREINALEPLNLDDWTLDEALPVKDQAPPAQSWRESELFANAPPSNNTQVESIQPNSDVDVTNTLTHNVVNNGIQANLGVVTSATGGATGGGAFGVLGALTLVAGMGVVGKHVDSKVSSNAGGGGGGGVSSSNGSGAFTAGPAIAQNGLHLLVYRADTGAQLEDIKVNDDGTYSFTTNYKGVVILVIRDIDTDPLNPGADYMDEAGGTVDLSVDLRSIAVLGAQGGAVTVNVTPLTEIAATIATGKSAAQAASAGYIEAALTTTVVTNTNKALAKILGLGDNVDVTSAPVTPVTNADGTPNNSMNNYGRVLAALSHAGDLSNVMATMAAGIQVNASGSASFNADAGSAAQVLMAQGMAEAETAQGISFGSMPALQTVKTEAVKAYSSVLIGNMLKQSDLLGNDLTVELTGAKEDQKALSSSWSTLTNVWVGNSALNKNAAFFETLNTSRSGFDNALGVAFNKALDQITVAKKWLERTDLTEAMQTKAQASYDQALASLKLQAQTVLDRLELQFLKQTDMAAEWAGGQAGAAALGRLNTSLNQLSLQVQADQYTAQAWQQTMTEWAAAQKNLSTVISNSKSTIADVLSAQAALSAAKQIVLQAESTSAAQVATDLAAWKLIASRRQAFEADPSNTAKQAAWEQALMIEAIQVQGDQIASDMLANALKDKNKIAVKACMLTAYNRAATDRVFADVLLDALDNQHASVVELLQQFAADKAEVDQLLSGAFLAKRAASKNNQALVIENLLTAQAAAEKLAAQSWEKAGADTSAPAFNALVAKNASNKVLVGLLLETFTDQDTAQGQLQTNPNDKDALKLLNRTVDVIEGIVKSFNQEALYQVQVAMDKVLRIDEHPDSGNGLSLDVLNLPQESVMLGIPEISDLIWSLEPDANYPDTQWFSLSSQGELRFSTPPDFEAATQKSFNLLVKIKDAQDHFVLQAIKVNMGNVNEAPVTVETVANQTLGIGRSVNLDVSHAFDDVDANDALTFSASGLPEGLRINNDGRIVGSPSQLQDLKKVTVTATDAGGLSVTQEFQIQVLELPSMQTVAPAPNSKTLVKAGDSVQLVVSFSEALAISGNGSPVLQLEFNGMPLEASFVGINESGASLGFSFIAPAMYGNSSLQVTDGHQLRVLGLKLNGSNLIGQTSGLTVETVNVSALTTQAVILDNTAPVSPVLYLKDQGFDNSDGLTHATFVQVFGIEASASWEYSLDSGVTWSAGGRLPNDAGSGFRLNAEQTYPAGSVRVRQTDAAGNVSVVDPLLNAGVSLANWQIDNTAPTVELRSNEPILKAGEAAHLTIVFTEVPSQLPSITSAAGQVSAWVMGNSNNEYSALFSPHPNFEGTASFNFSAWYDDAGNVGSTDTAVTIAVDTKPPIPPSLVLSDTGFSASDGVTSDPVIIVGQIQEGASWEYSLDGGNGWQTPTEANSFSLAEGNYSRGMVQIRQIDAAGNASLLTPSEQAWQIDFSAPITLINTVADDNVLNFMEWMGGVSVSGVSAGAMYGDQVLVQWNGVTLSTTVQIDGTWEVGFNANQLPNGELAQTKIRVRITDAAGNSSETFTAVDVDTIAPSVALPLATMPSDLNGWALNVNNAVADNILNSFELTAINTGNTWELSGTTNEAPQSITMLLAGHIFTGHVTVGSNGLNTWTVTDQVNGNGIDVAGVLSSLVHGNSYNLQVQGQDAAGNLSSWSQSSLLVKLYPPDVPTINVLTTNNPTPILTGYALKDTNFVDSMGEKIYSNLEDGDQITVKVPGQDVGSDSVFSLTLQANQDSNGPLFYNRITHQWFLDLSANQDSNGKALLLLNDGVVNIGVQVSAVGYALPIDDRSSNEVIINTVSPVLTWNNVAQDDKVNASETMKAITLSGTVSDYAMGTPVNSMGTPVNWAVGTQLEISAEIDGHTQTWSTTVTPNGTWAVQLTSAQAKALAQGDATFTAKIESVFGNHAVESHTVLIDTVAPTLTLTIPVDNRLSKDETKDWQTLLSFGDTTSGLDSVLVKLFMGQTPNTKTVIRVQNNPGALANLIGDLSQLSDGDYTVQVEAKDQAGNSTVQSLNLVIDQTAPVVSWSISPAPSGQNQTAVVTMTLSEAVPLSNLPQLSPSAGNLSAWTVVPNTHGLQYTAVVTPPANSTGVINWGMNAWTDEAGNDGSVNTLPAPIDFDTELPTVQSLDLINPSNKPLHFTDSLNIEVTFSENVTVIGAPSLSLQVGEQTRAAAYVGIKNGIGNVLVWRYTVQPGDNDGDGIAIQANAIKLVNNASIKDSFGNTADITHLALEKTSVLVDTTAPTATLSLISSETILAAGETAHLQIQFSEVPVSLPTLTATLGSLASWISVDDKTYTTVFTPSANVSGGTAVFSLDAWADAAGNAGNQGSMVLVGNKSITVDTMAPTVTMVTDETTAMVTNDEISFEVGLSEAIIGTWSDANFSATNGTVRSVTPLLGHKLKVVVTPNVNTENASVALSLVGGSLKDMAGNALPDQDLAGMDVQAIDTRVPAVVQVTLDGSPSIAGVYKAGEIITVNVKMSEAVTVTGEPQVALDIGGLKNRQASYFSGSGSDNLVFKYTIRPDDNDSDGVSVSANALNLPSGSLLRDPAGNLAAISHAGLGVNSAFKVDTVLPLVAISSNKDKLPSGATANLTFTFSEDPGTSFTLNDITVQGGLLGDLQGSGLTRTTTFTLSPAFNGQAFIEVGNSAFTDASGNFNADAAEANNKVFWWADSNAPSVALVAGVFRNSDAVQVQSSEVGKVYLVHQDVAVYTNSNNILVGDVNNITGAAGDRWNVVDVAIPNQPTALLLTGLSDGVYRAFSVDEVGNLSWNSDHTITVDNTPPSISSGGSARVLEKVAPNTLVYTTQATDALAKNLTYGLTGTDAAAFNIDSIGRVTLKASPDYETQNSYTFSVHVSDGVHTTTQTVTLSVDNVNEAPSAANTTVTLNEDDHVTFSPTDFGFTDAAGETGNFYAVNISRLPVSGTLMLSGKPLGVGSKVMFADLGQLVYDPAANANGINYASLNFTVQDDGGTANNGSDTSAEKTITFNVMPVNDAPTLTSVGTLTGFTEDVYKEISYADLATAANEADVDSTNLSFQIQTVSSGSLQKWNGSAWVDASSDTMLSVNEKLQWKPDTNANGVLNAFTLRADDGFTHSAAAIQVQANVAAVNDAPTFTSMSATADLTLEDTSVEITFAELMAKANTADLDGSVVGFVIQAVNSGVLKIGNSAASAQLFDASSNNTVNNNAKLYWTPAANANGILHAFNMVAKDDGGALSSSSVQVRVEVTSVNDAPALSSALPNITGVDEDSVNTTAVSLNLSGLSFAAPPLDEASQTLTYAVTAIPNFITLWKADGTTQVLTTTPNLTLDDIKGLKFKTVANGNGSGSIVVKVTDSGGTSDGGVDSASFSLNVTVNAVNDLPVLTDSASSAQLLEAGGVINLAGISSAIIQLSKSDVEGTPTYVTAGWTSSGGNTFTKAGTYGTFSLNTSSNLLTYTLDNNKPATQALLENADPTLPSASESCTVSVTDGIAFASVIVQYDIFGVNDAPALASPASVSYIDTLAPDAFGYVSGTLSASDPETTSLSYGISQGVVAGNEMFNTSTSSISLVTYDVKKAGKYGTLYLNSTSGAYFFKPNNTLINGLSGGTDTDIYEVNVFDGVNTVAQNLTVNITGSGEAATAANTVISMTIPGISVVSGGSNNPSYSATTTTSRTLTLNDFGLSDSDGDISANSILITSLPAVGSLTNNGVALSAANTSVSWADIAAGYLIFTSASTPTIDVYGNSYANIGYKVQDSAYTSNVKALTLNGTNEYVDIGALSTATNNQISSQVTLEAWVMATANPSANMRIFDLSRGMGTNNIILSTSYFRLSTAETIGNIDFPLLPINKWTHLAATIDGTQMSLYVDGVLYGTSTLIKGLSLNDAISSNNDRTQNWIGRSAWSSDPFAPIAIYDARIYNDARTQAEILQDLQGLVTPNDVNLLKRMTFDGSSTGWDGAVNKLTTGLTPTSTFTDNANTLAINLNLQAITYTGSANADSYTSNIGSDVLTGNAGNDALTGGSGNDSIIGSDGNDTINGNDNMDVIIGGKGSDTASGGAGSDTFKWLLGDAFDAATGAVPTTRYTDTVSDFSLIGGDKLDLTGLLSSVNQTTLKSTPSKFLNLSQSGTTTTALLKIDLTGAGSFTTPSMTISLTGAWVTGNLNLTLTQLMASKALLTSAASSFAYVDTKSLDTYVNTTGNLNEANIYTGAWTYTLTGSTTATSTLSGVTYDRSYVSSYGILYFQSTSGLYVFVPDAAAINAITANQTQAFNFTVSDGTSNISQTLTLNLVGANDTPVNTVPGAQTVAEGGLLNLTGINMADADTGTTYTVVFSLPSSSYGSLVLRPMTTLTPGVSVTWVNSTSYRVSGAKDAVINYLATNPLLFAPAANFTSDTSFNITMTTSDGVNSQANTVPIKITPVANDTPTAKPVALAALANETTTLSLSHFGYADPDGDPLSSVTFSRLPSSSDGNLQWNNGINWVDVTAGQTISAADIANGNVQFVHTATTSTAPLQIGYFVNQVDTATSVMNRSSPSPTGMVLRMDGVNDYSLNGSYTLPSGSMTIEMWLKHERLGTTTVYTSGASGFTLSGSTAVIVNMNPLYTPDVANDGETLMLVIPVEYRTADAWRHLAFTIDNTKASLFIDGQEVSSGHFSTPFVAKTAQGSALFARTGEGTNSNANYWKGEIYDFRIYSVARDAGQIQNDMQGLVNVNDPAPFKQFKFDGTDSAAVMSGLTFYDGLTSTGAGKVQSAPIAPVGDSSLLIYDRLISGTAGDDSGATALIGGAGADWISGGAGNDWLEGGAGNDLLLGGTGVDTMTGGAGADTFRFVKGDGGTTINSSTAKTITDFNAAEGDVLDLSDLLFNSSMTTRDFGGATAGAYGSMSNFLQLTQSGNDAVLKVDLQGTANKAGFATPDLVITLTGAWASIGPNLNASTGLVDETTSNVYKNFLAGNFVI